MSGAPRLVLPRLNCTLVTPVSSLAQFAVTVTVPETVPAVGAVMATVGGVESTGTNEAYTDCVMVSWLVRAPKVFG